MIGNYNIVQDLKRDGKSDGEKQGVDIV